MDSIRGRARHQEDAGDGNISEKTKKAIGLEHEDRRVAEIQHHREPGNAPGQKYSRESAPASSAPRLAPAPATTPASASSVTAADQMTPPTATGTPQNAPYWLS